MGDHGLYGFHKRGVDKITFNHACSYPEALGQSLVDFINETSIEELNEIFDKIILVKEGSIPTPEQIGECAPWTDLYVSTRSVNEWYCLLRGAQGQPNAYKEGLRYMIDSSRWIKQNSCYHMYIINLDTNLFECYVGYQESKPSQNRYGLNEADSDGYFGYRLIVAFPLRKIPNTWKQMLKFIPA